MMTESIRYIGVNDHATTLFEAQYPVPRGMAYNSYILLDDKIAVMDTVDAAFGDEWLQNIKKIIGDRAPDYLIIQHMEPDHSANIVAFTAAYPTAMVVASAKAFQMMKNFYGTDFTGRSLAVGEGSTLSLGAHQLTFYTAPMVHWPEVIVTYDSTDGVLFSADAFGKFGALDTEEEWACEARRYYIGIVGKYGAQVQNLLKKLSHLPIKAICPLHGPVLSEDLDYYIGLYDTWSSYRPEEEGVAIAYTSVYGNTKKAAEYLAEKLTALGCPKVAVSDLATCDIAEAVEDAFRYSKLVLATTTYNADVFPPMHSFIHHLTSRNFGNRTVALIENGSWAPTAAKVMRDMLADAKNITFAQTSVKILSAPDTAVYTALDMLAAELWHPKTPAPQKESEEKNMEKYVCDICGYVYDEAAGDPDNGIAPGTKWEDLPDDFACPLCGVGKDQFSKV